MTKTKWVSKKGSVGYRQEPVSETRKETSGEVQARVQEVLSKAKQKIPSSASVSSDPEFADAIEEVKKLLQEAQTHLRSETPNAVIDRVNQARAIMKRLADQY